MSTHQVQIYLEEARLVLENHFSGQRLSKAIQIYKEAIQNFPQASAEPYLALGFLALRAGLNQEARILLRRAASVEPFNPTIHKLLRYLNNDETAKTAKTTPAIHKKPAMQRLRRLNAPD